MFEQDYIMRQIYQFTEALERVISRKNEGNHTEALEIIDQSLNELPGVKQRDFYSLSLPETLSVVETDGNLKADLALSIASLLYEKGILSDENSETCFMQSLLLFKKTMDCSDTAFPLDIMEKISFLEDTLKPSNLEKIYRLLD